MCLLSAGPYVVKLSTFSKCMQPPADFVHSFCLKYSKLYLISPPHALNSQVWISDDLQDIVPVF